MLQACWEDPISTVLTAAGWKSDSQSDFAPPGPLSHLPKGIHLEYQLDKSRLFPALPSWSCWGSAGSCGPRLAQTRATLVSGKCHGCSCPRDGTVVCAAPVPHFTCWELVPMTHPHAFHSLQFIPYHLLVRCSKWIKFYCSNSLWNTLLCPFVAPPSSFRAFPLHANTQPGIPSLCCDLSKGQSQVRASVRSRGSPGSALRPSIKGQTSKLLMNNWHFPSLVTEQSSTPVCHPFSFRCTSAVPDKANFPLERTLNCCRVRAVPAGTEPWHWCSLVGHIPYWWALPCPGSFDAFVALVNPIFATSASQRAELPLASRDNLWSTLWFTFQMPSTRFWGWLQTRSMTLFSQNRAWILLPHILLPPLCHKEAPESDHCRERWI